MLSVLTIDGANNLGIVVGGSWSKYEIVLFLQLKNVAMIRKTDKNLFITIKMYARCYQALILSFTKLSP